MEGALSHILLSISSTQINSFIDFFKPIGINCNDQNLPEMIPYLLLMQLLRCLLPDMLTADRRNTFQTFEMQLSF